MDLQRLRYFVAVADELHFTRAAQRLYLDQGALSAAIRRLERELGVQLFDRTSRRVELTAAGAALLPRARRLVHDADALMAQVRIERRRDALRIGLFLGTQSACELTGPILSAFRAAYPDISLRVVELGLADWLPALRDGRVDVAVLRLPTGADDLHITPLFEEPRVMLLPRSHRLADAAHLTLAELEALQRDRWYRYASSLGQDRSFEQFYQLGDTWDVTELRFDDVDGANGWDIVDAVASGRVVTSTGASTARWYDPSAVAAPLLRGVPGSVAALASRAGDDRPALAAFAASARATTERLVHLVPDATLVDAVAR